jgi:two-component system, LytTR family, sensor kinase
MRRLETMAGKQDEINRRIDYPGPIALAVIWTVFGCLAYARHFLLDHNTAPPDKMVLEFLVWLTCFYPWIAMGPLVFRLERRYPLGNTDWARNLGWLTAASPLLGYLGAIFTKLLYLSLQIVFHEPLSAQTWWWRVPLREVAVQIALYWTTVGGAYVVRSLIQLRDREQQAAKLALQNSHLEATLRQAELEALRSRLNPHFLFNCLQNISVLTIEDPGVASQMLSRLGVLLRTALRQNDGPETTLALEVDLTKNYVAVEKIRFADRLTVLFDIASATELALVPTFLLQPLIENAIVHGLRRTQAGVISIRSAIESGKLMLAVADNGIGLAAASPADIKVGVGLTSTCERLQKMYPGSHSFSIRPLPEGGTEVGIALPLHFEPAGTEAFGNEQTTVVDRR